MKKNFEKRFPGESRHKFELLRIRTGLSLLELLVVVAIVGILIALVFPAFRKVTDSAKSAACVSNLRELGKAFMIYQAENQHFIPGDDTAYGNPENITWLSALAKYCDIRELSLCPAAPAPGDSSFDNADGNKWGGCNHAWALGAGSWLRPQNGPDHASYTMNMWARKDFMSHSIVENEHVSLGSSRVEGASKIPLIMDGRWEGIWPLHEDPLPPANSLKGKSKEIAIDGANWRRVDNVAMLRHGNGINICFFDGSVRRIEANDLWTLTWNKDYQDRGRQELH